MESILSIPFRQKSVSAPRSNVIVTVAVNFAYRKLALNFICNLKRLNISNYIVLAMDRPVYDFLNQRDAHVFFHDLSHTASADITSPLSHNETQSELQPHLTRHLSRRNLASVLETSSSLKNDSASGVEENDAPHEFGSGEFVETSRRKSLLVLRLLTLGYSVLFSDVDVVWISNPIPHMLGESGHFVIQSDRPKALPDSPLNFNVNSGLYLARAAPPTIIALRAIIKYAYSIRRSEQKAFNYVLCGAFKDDHMGPGGRVGSTECIFAHAGTTAQVLPLDSFPNGSDRELWASSSHFAKDYPRVVAVHANYVVGREEKMQRIERIGYWFHSEESNGRDECELPTL